MVGTWIRRPTRGRLRPAAANHQTDNGNDHQELTSVKPPWPGILTRHYIPLKKTFVRVTKLPTWNSKKWRVNFLFLLLQ
jgi:hypothetical protein